MFSRTKFIIFIYAFTSILYSQSDSIDIHEAPIEKGSANSIQAIFQDREGYLWFAVHNELERYDGYNFQKYSYNPEDTSGINGALITSIYEDKDSTLWIGNSQGLEKFDRSTNSFTNYLIDTSGAELSNFIYDMLEDQNKIFWISSRNGIYKFDKTKGKFTGFHPTSSDPGNISNKIMGPFFIDRQGSLWFGTKTGLDKFDYKSGRYLHFRIDSKNLEYIQIAKNITINKIMSICQDSSGTFWLGTSNGLFEFNQQSETFINYLPDPERQGPSDANEISRLCYMPSDMLWVGTARGLYIFNTRLKKFTHHYLGIHYISGLCIDKSGILWAGTWGGQIYKILVEKSPVKKYFTNGCNETVNLGNGIFWICTTAGHWSKFDSRRGIVLKKIIIPPNINPNNLFFGEDNGIKWYNDPDKGIYKIDRSGNITHFYNHSGQKFTMRISKFYKTSRGIWLSVNNRGLYFLNFKTRYIDLVLRTDADISVIYKDFSGIFWCATFGEKFYRYNPKNDSLTAFTANLKNPKSISGRLVYDIHEDIKHRLWIATNGGLDRFERSTKTFIHFTDKNDLPGNSVFNILEDNHGNLWLSTSRGISKFNPETNQFKNYDILQGVTSSFSINNFAYKASNGEFFFRRSDGLIRFHPDSIKENQFIPPIVITSFQLFGKPVPFAKEINLPYDKNFLSFEFSALSFRSPQRNQYAFKMDGIDKDWVYSGKRRYASYPNLAPGKYVFRVKGSNNDGVWNEAGTSIYIIITPPWWKTTWAYASYGLIFILALYVLRRYELNRVQLKNKIKMDETVIKEREEIDKVKSRFFANISHEFRTPLTLILGLTEKINSKTSDDIIKDSGIIKRNSKRLLQLVNQLLDLSRLEAGKLELETSKNNIVAFVKGIALSFESISEEKDITLKIESEKEYMEVYFDKEKMIKILSNILSNAFKFTPRDGKIIVSITTSSSSSAISRLSAKGSQEYVGIKIRDTGIGIPKEDLPKLFDRFYQVDSSFTKEYEGTGIGLALTKELVELHHGSVSVESEMGQFTEFTIILPLGKDHLKEEEIVIEDFSARKTEKSEISEIGIDEDRHLILNHFNDSEIKSEVGPSKEDKTIILIVEDNYDMREYIKESLDSSYVIEEAVNGQQGIRKAVKIIPDLIISDMMMPKMDGIELTRILKNDEKTSHIPIIILTAKSGQESKLEGLQTGADDYLTKPFDIKELRIRINNLIKIRRTLQEKYGKGEYILKHSEKKIRNIDEKFLEKILKIIEVHVSEEDFSIEELGDEIGMSRSQLHRKIKALTGKSPSVYVRSFRLIKAKKMIENGDGNISEIAYSVGFSSPVYFSACFKEEFGFPPKDLTL